LAQISTAFNQVANQIQVHQQQLQSWRLREELLNLLASQIRNSLDLEAILSTAVSETRELLGLIGVTSYGATLMIQRPVLI